MKTTSSFFALILALSSLSQAPVPCDARDRFEYDSAPEAAPVKPKPKVPASSARPSTSPAASGTVLAVGEIREVFDAASDPTLAFYVPAPGTAVVQVIIEKKFLRKPVYLVKALRPGTVSGGLVPRVSLDGSGYKPKNITEEARVQAAMKQRPITFTVR
jgi:hypothetical protein